MQYTRHMFALLVAAYAFSATSAEPSKPLLELQRDLVNLRFGMFIHFSPTTYLDLTDQLQPDHAPPHQGKDGVLGTADDLSPALFNPTNLDCGQWADAAKSAGMRFAVLTTKHHDGFCLWPSKYSTYTVAQGCKRDVVREFVDAFRQRGLKVGLYYSIRDRTAGIADQKHGGASRSQIGFIQNQLTELLTQYGPILYIVFDGWGNTWHQSPTFDDISYAEIYNHVKSLQPDCLVLNHSPERTYSDVPQIELHARMALPAGTDWPAVAGDTIQPTWFWRTNYPTAPLRSLDWIAKDNLIKLNERNIVFQLNCAPNRNGLLDDNVVKRLAEVGKGWTPPTPLDHIPESWKDWPVPRVPPLSVGPLGPATNLTLGSAGTSVRLDNPSTRDEKAYVPPFDAAAAGLTSLFDGKTPHGWEGDPESWKVVDGTIVGVKGNQNLMTVGDYDDFRLILSTCQVKEPSNHQGVGFWGERLPEGKYGYGGCLDVMPPMNWMWDYTTNKAPAGKLTVSRNLEKELGIKRSEWSQAEILVNRAKGTIRMAVNGLEMLYYTDNNPNRLKKGPIGLQAHGGNREVRYKNIFIEIAPKEDRLMTLKEDTGRH